MFVFNHKGNLFFLPFQRQTRSYIAHYRNYPPSIDIFTVITIVIPGNALILLTSDGIERLISSNKTRNFQSYVLRLLQNQSCHLSMIRDENRSYNSIKKLFIRLYYFQHTSKRTKVSKMEDTIKAQLRLVDEGRGCSIGFPPIESGEERIAILRRVSTPCKHGTRSPRAPSKLARSEWQDECG